MPTYRVQGPDGKIYRVQAGNEQEALSGLRANLDARKRVSSAPPQIRATSQGATLGLAGLADAGLAAGETAVGNLSKRATGKPTDYTAGQAFNAVRQANSDLDKQFAREKPAQSIGFGLLGGLAMPGAKMLATAAKPVATGLLGGLEAIGRGGAIGAGLGGAYGAATAAPGEELKEAKRGAITGGVTGGALPVAANMAGGAKDVVAAAGRTTLRAANRATGGQMLSPAREAGKRLAEALKKDGFTPDQIRQVQNEWMKNGVTPTLLDAVGPGSNTAALLRGAAMSGSGRQAADTYNRKVTGNLQDEALNLTRRLTGNETRTADQVRKALEAERATTASELYPTFQNDVVPVQAIGDALGGNTGRVALARARNIADTMRDQNALAEIDAIISGEADMVSAGTLDLIRRGLRDAGGKAARAGDNTIASGLAGRSGDLETALMDVPGFDAARNAYWGTSQAIDAIDIGATGFNAPPATFAEQIGALPEQAMLPAQVGYREAIETAIGRPTEGATGVLNRLATSTNQTRNMSAAFGDEAAQGYQAGLGNLIDQVNNARFINPNTNSQSAGRLADEALVDKPSFRPENIIIGLINKIRTGATLTDAERQALVELGTSNELPPEVGELLLRQPQSRQLGSRFAPAASIAIQNVGAGG